MISIGSVVVLYAAGLVIVGGDDAVSALGTASPLPLLGAVAAQCIVVLTWPLMHRASLRAVGEDLGFAKLLQVSMSAFTVSRTAPAGGPVGGALAVERMSRFGVPGPAATASVGLTGPITMTTVAGFLALGATIAVVAGDLPDRFLGIALAAVIFLWSIVKWSADVASLTLVLVAVGQPPRPTVILVGFGTTQLLAAIPTTPGSIGVVEGGLAGAFTAMGLPSGPAITIVILYRIVESWLPTVAGIPAVFRKVPGTADG